jgi:hypothetical protein
LRTAARPLKSILNQPRKTDFHGSNDRLCLLDSTQRIGGVYASPLLKCCGLHGLIPWLTAPDGERPMNRQKTILRKTRPTPQLNYTVGRFGLTVQRFIGYGLEANPSYIFSQCSKSKHFP